MAPRVCTRLVAAVVLLACAWTPVRADEDTVMAIVLHRHGDRSPVDCFPLQYDPNCRLWTDGFGMLTPTGMQQLHTLGTLLNTRYVGGGLINATYHRQDVHVRSTDYDRTLESVQSLLQGLFPPGTGPMGPNGQPGLTTDRLQPIPVHTVPKTEDDLLRSYTGATCPYFDTLRARDEATAVWQTERAKYTELFDALPAIVGVKPDINEMWQTSDPLVVEDDHGLPWPVGLTRHMFDQVVNISEWTLGRMYGTPELRRLAAGRYVEMLHDRLTAAATNQSQPGWDVTSYPAFQRPEGSRKFLGPRLYVYSAHDTTVAAVLSALGLFDHPHNPPYGANVVVELVRDTASSALAVRVFYNQGTDASVVFVPQSVMTLPGCSQLCPLDQFIQLTAAMTLGHDEWQSLCRPASPTSYWTGGRIAGLTVGLVAVVAIAVAATVVCVRRRGRSALGTDRQPLTAEHNEPAASPARQFDSPGSPV